MIFNSQIRRLYVENYIVDGPPTREWTNPFFIPSEQRLLLELVNQSSVKPNLIQSTYIPSKLSSEITNAPQPVDEGQEEGQEEERALFDYDPSFSPSANYYQNEVYKPLGDRTPFKAGDIIDEDLSDDRHLIVYNKNTNNLYVAHRGTDPTSSSDWINDVALTYDSEKKRLTEYLTGKQVAPDEIKPYDLLLGALLSSSEGLLAEAGAFVYGLGTIAGLRNKLNFNYHREVMDEVLEKYGGDINLKILGHSKAGAESQMMMEYLRGQRKVKPPVIPDHLKVYTYNSLPYSWRGMNSDPDLYPVKNSGDLASVRINNNHPNLRVIPKDRHGKKFKTGKINDPLNAHKSQTFVNYDYRYVPMIGN